MCICVMSVMFVLLYALGCSVLGDIDLIAEARAREASEFLEMLNTSCDGRKVHEAPQKEWKVCIEINLLMHLETIPCIIVELAYIFLSFLSSFVLYMWFCR
jgi:hypothetical protein